MKEIKYQLDEFVFHQGLGIFMKSISKYQEYDSFDDCIYMFNFVEDKEDSPELQAFLFEEFMVKNISSIYKFNE